MTKPNTYLPYSRQWIDDDDIAAVVEALRGEYLTTGPTVQAFEEAIADFVGADYAVAVSNGTSALQLAYCAAGGATGQVLITSPITFAATASAAKRLGMTVLFSDVDPNTGLMRPDDLERALSQAGIRACGDGSQVGVVAPVHLCGAACDVAGIAEVAGRYGLSVVDDAAHALGARYRSDKDADPVSVGGLSASKATTFSFHPVKPMTTLEGGVVTTNDAAVAEAIRSLRHHGVVRDPGAWQNSAEGFAADGKPNPWYYEIHEAASNERISDVQCALGIAQLQKLPKRQQMRQQLAALYDEKLGALPNVQANQCDESSGHARHLYAARVDFGAAGMERATVVNALRAKGIGTQVHYVPLPAMPAFGSSVADWRAELPGAAAYYDATLSLPLFPQMAADDIERVCDALGEVLG